MTAVFVGLTATVSLVWSHSKLLSQDEIYSLQTDRLPSVVDIVHAQRTYPISLDPLFYHLLTHLGMKVFGVGAFALRFPALLGFLLMQVCLYFFVRRLAGERAGMVAAAFPALTAAEFYATEGRPYGLMLGLYALALVCWQACVRVDLPGLSATFEGQGGRTLQPSRKWALAGLAVAVAGTINAHYFGVLLLIPLCAAEAFRTWQRRRLDVPVVAAIFLGSVGIVGIVPFLHGAAEFKTHYYNGGATSLHDITRAYRSMFVDYTRMSAGAQHVAMAVLVVFATGLVGVCVKVIAGGYKSEDRDSGQPRVLTGEWVMLGVLAGLPFCGYLLARYGTHSIEVRYVLGAMIAISAMVAIAAAPWLRRDGVFSVVVGVLLAAVLGTGVARVREERRASAATMASLVLPPNIKDALKRMPDGTLYIQDMGVFETASYYEPDLDVRAHLMLVYSREEELRWDGHDTMFLTATHLQHLTSLPIESYDAVRAKPGEHLFVLIHSGWNWTDQAFAEDAKARAVGRAMQGDVVAVKF